MLRPGAKAPQPFSSIFLIKEEALRDFSPNVWLSHLLSIWFHAFWLPRVKTRGKGQPRFNEIVYSYTFFKMLRPGAKAPQRFSSFFV